MDIETIEQKAKAYADARTLLQQSVDRLEERTASIRNRWLPQIRERASDAAEAKAALQAAVEESPELFKKPKSRLLHGIKLGFAKAKGKLLIANEEAVVKLIRRHFPDRFDTLVKVTEKPLKDPLARLTGDELKKLGVTLTNDTDEAFVKPADSAIDKLVDALLADDAEAGEDA